MTNTNTLTPDGLLFLTALAVAAVATLIYILVRAAHNDGVAVVPDFLVFGWWDITIHRRLVLIAKKHQHDPGLIAHYKCHLAQQARDGTITFWWRYLTDKRKRLAYEIEAYRAWLAVSPQDHFKVLWWLEHNYNTGLSQSQILALLARQT